MSGPSRQRIQDGKLRGLKTHDFHILLQQVIPVCLRNIGNPKVVGAVMRVSRLFRKICAKVVDVNDKVGMLEDVAETICSLEKERTRLLCERGAGSGEDFESGEQELLSEFYKYWNSNKNRNCGWLIFSKILFLVKSMTYDRGF